MIPREMAAAELNISGTTWSNVVTEATMNDSLVPSVTPVGYVMKPARSQMP